MAAGEIARAYWVERPGKGGIRPVSLPASGPGDVFLESLYSGVSRGTETLVFRGGVPESQARAMRCPHQEGEFPGPVKYGYSLVGRVSDGPEPLRGRTAFVLHPHQTTVVLPAAAVVPLPDGLPPARAVLAANMETALNIVWDACPQPGDRVCVIGAGVVGLLAGWLAAQFPLVSVRIHDIDPGKAGPAAALGLPFAADPSTCAPFDIVVHASGDPAGLRTALALAGFEAVIVEASWFGGREAALPLGEAFHSRRLTLRSSQVGAVAASRRGRTSRRRRLEFALRLLADDRLDVLISGESPFDSLPEVMAALAAGTLPALCHRIRY